MSRSQLRRARATAAAAALALLAGLLSACAGLPTTSAVEQGLAVGARPQAPVRVVPLGPEPGATPEQVVRGFLRAGVGVEDNDHAVARQYLTGPTRPTWEAAGGVWIYPGEDALTITATGQTITVTATVSGRIDGEGRYQDEPLGTQRQLTFSVARQDGDWRISKLPEGFGLMLSQSDVKRVFGAFDINYVSVTNQRLMVPDIRWFPVTSGLATTLARAQLRPVPDYLSGAVATGVPAGTRLDPDSVPVVAGEARLSLSGAALNASPTQRKALAAQLFRTLLQVPEVDRVSITVRGAPLDAGDEEITSLDQLGFKAASNGGPTVVLRTGSALTWQDQRSLLQSDAPRRNLPNMSVTLPDVPVGWSKIGVSRDGRDVTAASGDGLALARWRGGSMVRWPTFATHLTRPAYDDLGSIWVVGRQDEMTQVYTFAARDSLSAETPHVIGAPWLADRSVRVLRISRDGARAAVLSTARDGTGLRIDIAGIRRDPDGSASALDEPLRVGHRLTTATDLVWADESTLAVIGRSDAKESVRPYLVPVGGSADQLQVVRAAREVTTTGSTRGLLVRAETGSVSLRVGNDWVDVGTASEVILPGD